MLATTLNPLADNLLMTRTDLQMAVRALFAPLKPYFSRGGARVRLAFEAGDARGWFLEYKRRGLSWTQRLPWQPAKRLANAYDRANELESFARPLWGLAPLAAGGGSFGDWELYRRGLANGTDPRHPEYWGVPGNGTQALVEMAAVGFALALAPGEVWEPLEPRAKANLTRWLLEINRRSLHANNWLFFRVLVNLGLACVGAEHDERASQAALDQLESFYLDDGWYKDGLEGRRANHVRSPMNFYGLRMS